MLGRLRSRAFTLIELLVVIAIIALLISILLPSLKDAREQGKRALCLANMRSIGQASAAYASEDEREHSVPIFQNTVSMVGSSGWRGPWRWRTALPFCYGGQTPEKDFPGQTSGLMQDPDEGWTANHRPMNRYIYGTLDDLDSSGMRVYRCPSDQGYYSNWVQDAPDEAKGVPCFDYLGCSYRMVVAGFLQPSGSTANYYFSIAPWGHRVSSLVDTGKLAIYSEPMWYNFSRQNPQFDPDLLPVRGWHNQKMTDNVSFADGSARSTRVDSNIEWDSDTTRRMGISTYGGRPVSWYLRRGSTWRTDCYPTPGAFIRVRDGDGGWRANAPDGAGTGWPLNGYEDNIVDPDF